MEVNNKIRELTEKIHREGFEKATIEAERIKDEALQEAEKIREEARRDAEKVLEKARGEADKYAEKVQSDLRLSAEQSLLKLRKEISELLLAGVFDESVDKNMNDPHFVATLLEKVVENWKECNDDVRLEILLPDEIHASTEEQFKKEAAHLLSDGLKISPSKNVRGGFEIKPSGGNYSITMTDEAFQTFLKDNFRPVANKFLFGGKK